MRDFHDDYSQALDKFSSSDLVFQMYLFRVNSSDSYHQSAFVDEQNSGTLEDNLEQLNKISVKYRIYEQ